MAVVNKVSKAAPAPDAPAKAVDTTPETLRLELKVLNRYWFAKVLYEKGKVYEFGYEDGRTMLAHDDDLGRPVFTLSKPKPKYVQVADDGDVVKVRKPREPDRTVQPLDEYFRNQRKPVVTVVTDGPIELGADDTETAERLKKIDAAAAPDGDGQVI